MKLRSFIELLALAAVFGAIWFGFTKLEWSPEANIELSIEKEEAIGEMLRDLFLEDYEELESEVLDSAMFVIESRLLRELKSDYDYDIIVVDSDEINAFATMGGYIVVFSGLIELTDKPEELAAVLAHEIGHIEHQHLTSRLIKEIGLSVLFSIAVGDNAVLSELYQSATSSVFDRSQEKEADQFSLQLMEDAGIDPMALADFFKKVSEEEWAYPEKLEFLMSHPNNNSRIKASEEFETGEDFTPEPIELDWERVKMSLD